MKMIQSAAALFLLVALSLVGSAAHASPESAAFQSPEARLLAAQQAEPAAQAVILTPEALLAGFLGVVSILLLAAMVRAARARRVRVPASRRARATLANATR